MRDTLALAAVGIALFVAIGAVGNAHFVGRAPWHRRTFADTTRHKRDWYARLVRECAGRG